MAPTTWVGSPSPIECQGAPQARLSNTPPATGEAKNRPAIEGSYAKLVTRPERVTKPRPPTWAYWPLAALGAGQTVEPATVDWWAHSGATPYGAHAPPLPGKEP